LLSLTGGIVQMKISITRLCFLYFDLKIQRQLESWSDVGCWQNLLIWCSFVDGMIEDVMLIISEVLI
jgi:hypothetical protein